MTKKILLTGATGFVGRSFLDDLVQSLETRGEDYELMLVSRDSKQKPYDQRIAVPKPAKRKTKFLRGDITSESLGLSDSDYELARTANEVWHMAASTDFSQARTNQTMAANVGGTENLIQILGGSRSVERLFYVSTAYSCGMIGDERIDENTIPFGSPRNPYELSKKIAEMKVRASGIPWTILKPSIVVGDLRSGEANTHKMIYGVLNAFVAARKYTDKLQITVPGRKQGMKLAVHAVPSSRKNFIACDDLNRLMLAAREKSKTGRAYHLVNPQPSTFGELVSSIAFHLGIEEGKDREGYYYTENPEEAENASRESKLLHRILKEYLPYQILDDPDFGIQNMMEIVDNSFRITEMSSVHPRANGGSCLDFLIGAYLEEYHPQMLIAQPYESGVRPIVIQEVKS